MSVNIFLSGLLLSYYNLYFFEKVSFSLFTWKIESFTSSNEFIPGAGDELELKKVSRFYYYEVLSKF